MAIRKPIVIIDSQHLSELQAGDGLLPYLNPATTTSSQLIQALLDVGIMAPAVVTVPVNLTAPVVTGAFTVGGTVSTSMGTWDDPTPLETEYRWQINDSGWTDVSGETDSSFDSIPLGEYRSAVRVRNSAGWSDWAYSSSFVIAEAAGGIVLDGPASANAVLSDGGTTLARSGTGDYATAWSDAELSGKVYMEVILRRPTFGDNFVAFTGDGVRPSDTTNPILHWNTPRAGAALLGWSSFFRANYGMSPGDTAGSITSYDAAATQARLKIAIDLNTRQFWIKEVGSAFQGDPAAGTGQLFTLLGTADIMVGAVVAEDSSVSFISPDEHIDTPPAGFVPH